MEANLFDTPKKLMQLMGSNEALIPALRLIEGGIVEISPKWKNYLLKTFFKTKEYDDPVVVGQYGVVMKLESGGEMTVSSDQFQGYVVSGHFPIIDPQKVEKFLQGI